MRTVKWNAFLSGLCGFAMVLGAVAGSARADVTTEKGSSILVFPKLLADGTFDSVIQITNTGNSMVHARCFYVNASLQSVLTGFDCSVPSATCVPIWQETDFTIWLTKQQPTHWLLSTGRRIDGTDGFGRDGSGFDPGRVPPVGISHGRGQRFEGELKCIEVSESEEPVTGNHLKGEATLKAINDRPGKIILPATVPLSAPVVRKGDVSKYNAIGILGNPDAQPSNTLLLDDDVYNKCPAKLIVNHFATGAIDPASARSPLDTNITATFVGVPGKSFTSTELTLVPCSEDFENQRPTSVTVQFLIFNEFEERFSASTTVTCYLSTELTNIDSPTHPERSVFSAATLGTTVAHTEITPVVNLDGSIHAVLGVAERISSTSLTPGATTGLSARAAYDLHFAAKICTGGSSPGLACTSDDDCGGGTCAAPPDQITLSATE